MNRPEDVEASRFRFRRVRLAAGANVLSRLAGVALLFASVKLTVGYLGADRFGAWMLLSSLMAMLSFMDLGVGNALTNRVAMAAASSDKSQLRRAVTGGIGSLLVIALVAWLLLTAVALIVPWEAVLRRADEALVQEARHAAVVLALVFAATLVSSGIQKIFLGLQQSHIAHLASAFASLMALVGLILVAGKSQGVAALLAATSGLQAVAGVFLLGVLAFRGLLPPREWWQSTRAEMPTLLRTGSLFLLLQIGTLIGWGADSLIISTSLGAAQVAIYAVVQRLFMFASVPLAVVNQPLWGAYADAFARGDRSFIRSTLVRSLRWTLVTAAVISALLVAFHGPLLDAWTGGTLTAPLLLVIAFAVWVTLEATATCASMYLNGCHVVKPQVAAVIVFCALSIPLKLLMAQQWGSPGVVLCTIVSYLIAVPLLYAIRFRAEVLAPLQTKHD
ncbi:MAG: hypothetical protein JNJ71_02675 [Rubrivivax sp.]|nr:hypothetical protein [Rubrivivax sp.]